VVVAFYGVLVSYGQVEKTKGGILYGAGMDWGMLEDENYEILDEGTSGPERTQDVLEV
jgi:hypothetical protein